MGGGVGKVLSNICIHANYYGSAYKHKILLIERPKDTRFVNNCIDNSVELFLADETDTDKLINEADIVQLEWWHHPGVLKFLIDKGNIKKRLVVWSHISGTTYPLLPVGLVEMSDRFIFTTPFSYENPSWSSAELEMIKRKSQVIPSFGGVDNITFSDRKNHRNFNIGYLGTMDFSKMFPGFMDYCSGVDIDDIQFMLSGYGSHIDRLKADAEKLGISKKCEFKGYINDVNREYARYDVTAYLLTPEHTATTENALLEAMAAGVVPVAFNQNCEKYIIQHMKTGILINNKNEFVSAIKYLYNNRSERQRMSREARNYVLNNYSTKDTIEKLDKNYTQVMNDDKKIQDFTEVFGKRPWEWFLSCLNDEKEYFIASMVKKFDKGIEKKISESRYLLKGENKSSLMQYYRYFPEDEWLSYWDHIIEMN